MDFVDLAGFTIDLINSLALSCSKYNVQYASKTSPLTCAHMPFLFIALGLSCFGYLTSSSIMVERPRELGDFKKAQVNGGTDNHSLKGFSQVSPHMLAR